MRTDENNNPTAFTTAIAEEAELLPDIDYEVGTPFKIGPTTYFTAKLVGDPIALTIQVIDKIGYYTISGLQRWTYIGIPKFTWDALSHDQKRDVIGFHYRHEGGITMRPLFPNYSKA